MANDSCVILTFIEGTDKEKILIFFGTEHIAPSSKCKEHTDVEVVASVIFVASIHFCLISES